MSTERRPRISTRTASVRVMAVSLAASGVIAGGLATQMAHGHDPALGSGTSNGSGASSGSSTSSSSGSSTPSDSGSSFEDQQGFQDQSGSTPSGVVTRAS